MKYRVRLPFSHKFNGVRKEVKVGDIISDKEIEPNILAYVLSRGKLQPIVEDKKKDDVKAVSKEESKGKKKVRRISKEAVKSEPVREEVVPVTGCFDLGKNGLKDKTLRELRVVAKELGLPMSGTKEILRARITKSGI